jgi:hypothetical protein
MAKLPTIVTIVTGYFSTAALNNNFTALKNAFSNTLSRDGSTPNTMAADIDMDGNDLLNVGELDVDTFTVGGESVGDYIAQAAQSASDASGSANAAAQSASDASDSAAAAAVSESNVAALEEDIVRWESDWQTATAYEENDLVRQNNNTYICISNHTSGTFSTDLGNNLWELFVEGGADGVGVPAGGTTGQVLRKESNDDYDTGWLTLGAGAQAAALVQAVWETGTSTVEAIVSPAKIKAAIDAVVGTLEQAVWEAGTSTTEAKVSPAKVKAAIEALAGGSDWTESSVTSTSTGTVFDETGLPNGITELEIIFNGVSLDGAQDVWVQLGTGASPTTSGYTSAGGHHGQTFIQTSTTDFRVYMQVAAFAADGRIRFIKEPGSNLWTMDYNFGFGSGAGNGGGRVTLSGDLNNFRIGRAAGNFDGGSFWYRYK